MEGNKLGLLNRDILEMYSCLNYIQSPPKEEKLGFTWKEIYGLGKNHTAFRRVYDGIISAEGKLIEECKTVAVFSEGQRAALAELFKENPEFTPLFSKFLSEYKASKYGVHYNIEKYTKEWNVFMLKEADIEESIDFFKVKIPAEKCEKIPNIFSLMDRIIIVE